MSPLEIKLLGLLKEAREVLGHYWFTDDENDSWSNQEVIDMSDKIDKELESLGK